MRRFFVWLWLAAAVAVSALVLWRSGSYRSLVGTRSAAEAQVPTTSGCDTVDTVRPAADSVAVADTLHLRTAPDTISAEGHDIPVSPAAGAADTLRVVR